MEDEIEDGVVDLMFDRLAWKNPLPSLGWDFSHLAAAPSEQSSAMDNLTERSRSHYSGGASGASVLENRKSHGLTPYDEDMGNTLHEPTQKAALASPSSNASGAASPQGVMSRDASQERDGELEQEINFKRFFEAVLGDPRQYALTPAFARPTWRNGEPVTLGVIFAARVHLLEGILAREGQSCHQSIDMPREPR